MKLKAVVTAGAPEPLVAIFGAQNFTKGFLGDVVSNVFGVEDPWRRPAEYYVQLPDRTVQIAGCYGVEVRLTGVSRGDREPKVFHKALEVLERLVIEHAKLALRGTPDIGVQVFVVIMIDGDVPGHPASETPTYGSVQESVPKWVTVDGVEPIEK